MFKDISYNYTIYTYCQLVSKSHVINVLFHLISLTLERQTNEDASKDLPEDSATLKEDRNTALQR